MFGAITPPTDGIVSGRGDGSAVSHPAELGLFRRDLSNVRFTITPSPQSTYSSFCSAGNWLCFARSGSAATAPLARPAPVLSRRGREIGFVWRACPRGGWQRQGRRPWRWSCRPIWRELGLFVQLAPAGQFSKLALFCIVACPDLSRASPNWLCLYRGLPTDYRLLPFGFVCHEWHR